MVSIVGAEVSEKLKSSSLELYDFAEADIIRIKDELLTDPVIQISSLEPLFSNRASINHSAFLSGGSF